MSYGYPDYNRLNTQIDTQLFSYGSSILPNGLIVFEGFVGPWAYVNLFASMYNQSDFGSLRLDWFTDSTFTSSVQTIRMVRTQYNAGAAQYANISPWLRIKLESASGNDIEWYSVSATLTNGFANSVQLNVRNAPGISVSETVGASTTVYPNWTNIVPGPGKLFWYSAATSWAIHPQYYDWDTATWVEQFRIYASVWAQAGAVDLPLVDAPTRLSIANYDTTAQLMDATWIAG